MMAETQSLAGDIERYSKYQIIATQAGLIKKVSKLQKDYPDLMYFRMFNPHEYLGWGFETNGETCTQGNGIPFNFTTASTNNCGVYAGHWLYRAGTTTTSYINTSATSVTVSDASLFKTGQYAVIYDAPAGSFNNAEHVLVTSRNTSTNTLTISRAYKSNAQQHPNGSIIAQHVLGQSSSNDPRNWVFNLGVNGPKDASGRRLNAYLPVWLQGNYKKTWTGELTDAVVSGFLFDSDANFLSTLAPNETADMDNNLVVDNGISVWGQNWYLEGLENFYANLRALFPNHIISGGTRDAQGFDSLNGVQMEGFPAYDNFSSTNPSFHRLDGLFAKYRYQSRHKSTGPAHSHVLSKMPSALYPVSGNPTSNQTFRFALGMTLLEDGYFASFNSATYPDIWYDEYAVDVTPGSSTYGYAIASNVNDESAVRAHTGWLGRPQGVRKRIYDDSTFAVNKSLLQNGTFENTADLAAWQGIEVTTSIDSTPANVQDGTKAIRVSQHLSYQENFWEAAIRGPKIPVVAGRQYTLVFSAKATTQRDITAQAVGLNQRIILGPEWQRFVITFVAESTGSFPIRFNVGAQSTETWFDSVYFFEGNANIYRRDFDNGIVVVNATPQTQTIDLDGTFLRINGTQQPVNNGASISSVTLPPYDSALLVRRKQDVTRASSINPAIFMMLLE